MTENAISLVLPLFIATMPAGRLVVSADGKYRIAKTALTTSDGNKIKAKAVYEKQ